MSIFVTENFIRRRGMDSLVQFHRMLNEGKKLNDIATFLGISVARVTVLRDHIFSRKYHFKNHVQIYLKAKLNISQYHLNETRDKLGKDNVVDFQLHRDKLQ